MNFLTLTHYLRDGGGVWTPEEATVLLSNTSRLVMYEEVLDGTTWTRLKIDGELFRVKMTPKDVVLKIQAQTSGHWARLHERAL